MTRRLLVLPDKFRGSLTAAEFCSAVAGAVAVEVATAAEAGAGGGPSWSCEGYEMSDGGEGFVRIVARDGEVHRTTVTGPLGKPVAAEWRVTEVAGRRTAVIEAAAACGLALAGGAAANDPVGATTRGVGELVLAALGAGVDEIVVGCGGSASTDGGRGALEAFDSFPPGGSEMPPLQGTALTVAFDVRARFRDAAARFGPQKGASPGQVLELEARLDGLADLYRRGGVDLSDREGSGSAGGLAGGLAAAGGTLRPGFEVVADSLGIETLVATSHAVVTGEGTLDGGSFTGKVVGGVLDLCTRETPSPSLLCVVGRATPPARERAEGYGAAVAVLSERFGAARSLAEPGALVALVVREWLDSLPAP